MDIYKEEISSKTAPHTFAHDYFSIGRITHVQNKFYFHDPKDFRAISVRLY